MSIPKIEKNDNPIDRNQSISNLIESVALIETGLSHIINAEGEKIQKVVNSPDDSTVDEMLKVNNSVEKMISSISKLEMVLQNKLESTKDLDEIVSNGSIIPYASKYVIASIIDGVPTTATVFGFGSTYDSIIELNGNTDVINVDDPDLHNTTITFSMPRDGVLDAFTAFVHLRADQPSVQETQIVARLYVAEADSQTYYPLEGAMIHLEPKITDQTSPFTAKGIIKDLNIKLTAESKILMLVYLTSNDANTSYNIGSFGGGGINVK